MKLLELLNAFLIGHKSSLIVHIHFLLIHYLFLPTHQEVLDLTLRFTSWSLLHTPMAQTHLELTSWVNANSLELISVILICIRQGMHLVLVGTIINIHSRKISHMLRI